MRYCVCMTSRDSLLVSSCVVQHSPPVLSLGLAVEVSGLSPRLGLDSSIES